VVVAAGGLANEVGGGMLLAEGGQPAAQRGRLVGNGSGRGTRDWEGGLSDINAEVVDCEGGHTLPCNDGLAAVGTAAAQATVRVRANQGGGGSSYLRAPQGALGRERARRRRAEQTKRRPAGLTGATLPHFQATRAKAEKSPDVLAHQARSRPPSMKLLHPCFSKS
jgi:hypothetical protein